jgi:peptidoglycan-associated lipoprotein
MRTYSLRKLAVIVAVGVLTVLAGACKKKVAPAPPVPTPAPAAAAPTVSLKASPTFITSGQSSTLSWTSQNATSLDLSPGIGSVAAEGSTQVSPTVSTTYTITATGPGGTATDSARVTVGAGALPPGAPPASLVELFNRNVRDAFFDFDKSDIRPDARETLSRDAEFFRSHPEVNVTIEGHCDERGSIEYNLGLGQRRADAAKEFLVSLGVAAERMKTMSWGKERPFCTEHNETCWQENRRAHFVMAK